MCTYTLSSLSFPILRPSFPSPSEQELVGLEGKEDAVIEQDQEDQVIHELPGASDDWEVALWQVAAELLAEALNM
jgi:hypothetical protein